jgi:hypothetical protein
MQRQVKRTQVRRGDRQGVGVEGMGRLRLEWTAGALSRTGPSPVGLGLGALPHIRVALLLPQAAPFPSWVISC